jgi:mono/diheme cytochrome c family protein
MTYCADCHQSQSLASMFKRPPQAPELADIVDRAKVPFGTRDWTRSIVTNYAEHMRALKNITATDNDPQSVRDRAEAAQAILSGDMATWSAKYGPELLKPANKPSLDALVEFLVDQSGRFETNADLVAQGRQVFAEGKLVEGEIAEGERCVDCHNLMARGDADPLSDSGYGPNLTGYGGRTFLDAIIRDPASQYTNANAMPAFGSQLSDRKIEMLARWLSGEYHHAPE